MSRNSLWTAQNAAQKLAEPGWIQPYGQIGWSSTKATTYDSWGSFAGVSTGTFTGVTLNAEVGTTYAIRVAGAGSVMIYDAQGYLLNNEPRLNASNAITGWMLRPETSGTYHIEIFGDFVFGLGVEADAGSDGKNAVNGTSGAADIVPIGVYRLGTVSGEKLTGTAFADKLDGDAGDDTLVPTGGNDVLFGGDGRDTVLLTGARHTDVVRSTLASVGGSMSGELTLASGQKLTLDSVEAIRFDDGQYVYDMASVSKDNGDVAYRLYRAALGRVPDEGGLAVQVNALDHGTSALTLAHNFANSAEFRAKYGTVDNAAYATLLYTNVLGRGPDAGGLAVQVSALNGGLSRDQLLLNFSESAENRTNTAPDTAHGYFLL